jgi:hypothetical protein
VVPRRDQEIRGIHEVIIADASSDDSATLEAQRGGAVVKCERPNQGRHQNAGLGWPVVTYSSSSMSMWRSGRNTLMRCGDADGIVSGASIASSTLAWLRQCGADRSLYNRNLSALQRSGAVRPARRFQSMGGFKDIP